MNEHFTEDDRALLDMLGRVVRKCIQVTPDMQSWEYWGAYRETQDVLEEALVGLVQAKLKEKNHG